LRRKIFDSLQDFTGLCFVDLCTGTGAFGLEALSRGAEQVWLIDSNKKIVADLGDTLKKLPKALQPKVKAQCQDASSFLSQFKAPEAPTVYFLDPPYKDKALYIKSIKKVLDLLTPESELWIEASKHEGITEEEILELLPSITKKYSQSDHYLFRFCLE
jgi:16S rRNA (guanine966-N2)-methyltransferase